MQALDVCYLINKLRSCAAILHYKSVTKFEGEPALMPELLQHLQHHDYSAYPAISIYHLIILTLLEPENENHFRQLHILLLKNHMLFPKGTAHDMYHFCA